MTAPRSVAGSIVVRNRWDATIGTYSIPCVPDTSASTGPRSRPLTIVNGMVVP
jgi:hypothetical protein